MPASAVHGKIMAVIAVVVLIRAGMGKSK